MLSYTLFYLEDPIYTGSLTECQRLLDLEDSYGENIDDYTIKEDTF